MLSRAEFVEYYNSLQFPLVNKALFILKSDKSDTEKLFDIEYMFVGSKICQKLNSKHSITDLAKETIDKFTNETNQLEDIHLTLNDWYSMDLIPGFQEYTDDVKNTFENATISVGLEQTPLFEGLLLQNCTDILL